MLLVDAGNMSLGDLRPAVVFPILKKMGYCATGVAAGDEPYLDKYILAAKDAGIDILNVTVKDRDGIKPYIVQKVGKTKVGILSFGFVQKQDDNPDLQKRRLAALKEVQGKCDFLILLDYGNVANEQWLQEQAALGSAPNVVMGGIQTTTFINKEKVVGNTWILPSTTKTKRIGLLNVQIEPDKAPQMDYSEAALDESVASDPEILKAIDGVIAAENERSGIQSRAVDLKNGGKTSWTDAPANCQVCHKRQYDSWAASKHAAAMKPLIDRGRDIGECLICHNERYRQTMAYLPYDPAWKLGVECVSCHSNVLPHGQGGPDKATRAKVSLDTCRACHNNERSPDFERKAKKYMAKVKH